METELPAPPAGAEEVVLQDKQVLEQRKVMEQGKRGGGEDGVREVHLKKKKVENNMSKCTNRWGVGGEAKTEEKELSPITRSQTIFLPLKKSPPSWWDTAASQPYYYHTAVKGLSWRHVHNPVMVTRYIMHWLLGSWPCGRPSEGRKYAVIKDSSI